MDLLAILPYYIEVALQKDTVSLLPSNLLSRIILSDASLHIHTVNALSFLNLAHVSLASRLPSVPLQQYPPAVCFFSFLMSRLLPHERSREPSTIEVMYLSFRRSRDALLALGFFVLMVVIVFSTLLYVRALFSSFWLTHHKLVRYFIERGTWDDTLEVFINSDGDPSQFAVSPHFFPFLSPRKFLTAHI